MRRFTAGFRYTGAMAKCIFCHRNMSGKGSREHLLSRPICDVFGVERAETLHGVLADGPQVSQLQSLDGKTVRLPCRDCNQGWMSSLEVAAAETFEHWVGGRAPIGADGLRTVTRWMVKNFIVFGAIHGDTRTPFRRSESGELEYAAAVLVEPRRARALREDTDDAYDNVDVGAARTVKSVFTEGFGNPIVRPTGPGVLNARSAGVLGLNLPPFQLWAVVRPRGGTTRLPEGVKRLRTSTSWRHLRTRSPYVDPTSVVVTYHHAVRRSPNSS